MTEFILEDLEYYKEQSAKWRRLAIAMTRACFTAPTGAEKRRIGMEIAKELDKEDRTDDAVLCANLVQGRNEIVGM